MNGARTVEAAVEAAVDVAVEAAVAVTHIGRHFVSHSDRPCWRQQPRQPKGGQFLAQAGDVWLQTSPDPILQPRLYTSFYTAGTGECGERLPEVNCQPRAMTLALKVSEDNRILQS